MQQTSSFRCGRIYDTKIVCLFLMILKSCNVTFQHICSLSGSTKYNVLHVSEAKVLRKETFHQCCYTNKTISALLFTSYFSPIP